MTPQPQPQPKKDWRTTLGGLLTALGLLLGPVSPVSVTTNPTITKIGGLLAIVGSFITGKSAADSTSTNTAKKEQ